MEIWRLTHMEKQSSRVLKFNQPPMIGIVAFNRLAVEVPDFLKDRTDDNMHVLCDQPIMLGQFAVLYNSDGWINGIATWAWLNEEEEIRFIREESVYGDFEYRSEDDVLWILDFIAPFGHRDVWFMARELAKHFSEDKRTGNLMYARAMRIGGRIARFSHVN